MRVIFTAVVFVLHLVQVQCILHEVTNVAFTSTEETAGIAVTDLDNDGTFEVIVAVMDGPNKIVKYDETTDMYYDAGEIDTQYDMILSEASRTRPVCTCDMDGDGLEEIYIQNHNEVYPTQNDRIQPDRLLKYINGEYTDLFLGDGSSESLVLRYGGHTARCIDRTGSGLYDIIVTTYSKDGKGAYKVFTLQPLDNSLSKYQLAEISEDIGLGMDRDGRGVLVGPLFPDNPYSDIFITNDNRYHIGSSVTRHDGRNVLFRNKGDGTFENVAANAGVEDRNNNGRGSSFIDVNRDGRVDLLFTNWLGPTYALQQDVVNSSTYFREVAGPAFTSSSAANILITGDLDNDGHAEILKAGANVDQPFQMYNELFKIFAAHNSSDAGFIKVNLDAETKLKNLIIRGIATADINNDGILELFISHEQYHNRTFSIFQTNNTYNNWIRFIPLSKYGSFARGSTVILSIGYNNDKRPVVIGGDCSFMCQSEPVAHFGLGGKRATEVEIVWPDGHTFKKGLYDHDNNKTLVISYTGNVSYRNIRTSPETHVTSAAVISYNLEYTILTLTLCIFLLFSFV